MADDFPNTPINKDIWNTLSLTTYQIPLSTRLFWIHYGWRFPKYHCQQEYMEYLIADDLSNTPVNKDIRNTLSLTIYQMPLSTKIYGIPDRERFTKCPYLQGYMEFIITDNLPKYPYQQGYMEYLIADDLPNTPVSKEIWNTSSLTIYQDTPVNKDIWNTLSLTIYQMPLSTRIYWIHDRGRFTKYPCKQGYMEYLIADDLLNTHINKDIWNTLSLTIYQISLPTRIYGIHYHWQFTKIPLLARKYGIPYRWRFIKCPCQQRI